MSQEPQHSKSLVSVAWLNKANAERDTAIALMRVALDQREKTEALNAELLAALKEARLCIDPFEHDVTAIDAVIDKNSP
jgi:hypothetical protein